MSPHAQWVDETDVDTYEESPRQRLVRLSMVACFGIAPLLGLTRHPIGGLVVFIVGGYLYSRLNRITANAESPGVRSVPEQVARGLLGAAAVSLGLLALYLVAVPHFPGCCRLGSNESAAIATLKNLAASQRSFRARAILDHDGDGIPAFGSFLDLALADPPELSPAFARLHRMQDGTPVIRRSGYHFQLRVIEPEAAWCCYAWPGALNNSGKRVFFVDQSGVVRASTNRRQHYSGEHEVPRFDAVWRDDGDWREVR